MTLRRTDPELRSVPSIDITTDGPPPVALARDLVSLWNPDELAQGLEENCIPLPKTDSTATPAE